MRGVSALGRLWRTRLRLPRIGRIFRFRLQLHRGWFIAFILITAMVVTQFPEAYPLWQRLALGIVASLFFFVAVSIREIALSFLAISRGMPVKRITLFVFGGVSPIAREETLPVLEVLLAMAGLLFNLIITGIFYGVHSILVNTGNVQIDGLVLWLAFMYFMLALFHFIPAFPLDMGRLLLALLWGATGNYERAAGIASWVGRGIGLLIIAGGVLLAGLAQQWFYGVVLAFVGWMLHTAAVQTRHPMTLRRLLRGVKARDVVAWDCPVISSKLSLGQLAHDYMLVTGQRYFVVARGTRLAGVVSVRDVKKVPKKRRHLTTVAEVMTPASELRSAQAEQSAASLLEQMNEWRIDHMPVLEQDRVVGIVIRDSLKRLVKTRTELRK